MMHYFLGHKSIMSLAIVVFAWSSSVAAQELAGSMRGIRLEGNLGGDRFQSEGAHSDKFGYGATIGFDGIITDRIVLGPEASFWRANNWTENCTRGVNGGAICHKSFEEYGAAVRAGYLVTPQILIFGKGGYVNNEQRKRFDAPPSETSFYNHFNSDGYQVGGGMEYSLTKSPIASPIYVNVQYVFSQYDDHTSRKRLFLGAGIRFK